MVQNDVNSLAQGRRTELSGIGKRKGHCKIRQYVSIPLHV